MFDFGFFPFVKIFLSLNYPTFTGIFYSEFKADVAQHGVVLVNLRKAK